MSDASDHTSGVESDSAGTHSDSTPRQVERQILAISSCSPGDQVSAAIDAADWLMGRAKSIQGLCKQIAIHWIEHNGDLTVGPVRYHVGYSTTTRCIDSKRCGLTLLDALSGDFDGFLNALVAQPYKHAHARSILEPSTYKTLFATESLSRLVNGVPERTLAKTDTRFATARTRSRTK